MLWMFTLLTAATCLCYTNISVAETASFDSDDTANAVVAAADAVVAESNGDADDEQCDLRTWYMAVLAEGLLLGTYRRQEKIDFQAEMDELLATNEGMDVTMSCNQLDNYYNRFVRWREKQRATEHDSQLDDGSSSQAVLHASDDHRLPLHQCSATADQSYPVCYYAAISQHICLHNVSHDYNDAQQYLSKQRPGQVAETSAPKRGQTDSDSAKVSNGTKLSDGRTLFPAVSSNKVVDDKQRQIDESVPAAGSAATVAKVSKASTPTASNTAQKPQTNKPNNDVKEMQSGKNEMKTKQTSTNGKPSNKTVPVIKTVPPKSIPAGNANGSTVANANTSKNVAQDKQRVISPAEHKRNDSKRHDTAVKSNTNSTKQREANDDSKPSESAGQVESSDSQSKFSGELSSKEEDLSQQDETDVTEIVEMPAGRERSRDGDDAQYKQQVRSLEMKMLQLENQLLKSTINQTSDKSTAVQLENYVLRLERELSILNHSFADLKTDNDQMREKNSEAETATNSGALATFGDQQRKLNELVEFINNQSSFVVELQDKYASLERENRLLVERVFNQSLMLNQLLLHVDTLGREQAKQTMQLMELKQRGSSGVDVARSSSASQRHVLDHATMFPDPPIYKSQDSDVPKDCFDHYERGVQAAGELSVRPAQRFNSVDVSVFCDRGWTLIQRRLDGTVDFYRSWNDYNRGFGGVSGEHWLGNNAIHLLTNQDHYSLRISLTDWNDLTYNVDYAQFRITDESDGYRLYVAGYREEAKDSGGGGGTVAGDSLLKHNGCRFSTFDVDNDLVNDQFEHGSCARRFSGAWWYYNCYMSNLNGRYYTSGTVPGRMFDGIAWKSWTGSRYSLKRVEMMIRPSRVSND